MALNTQRCFTPTIAKQSSNTQTFRIYLLQTYIIHTDIQNRLPRNAPITKRHRAHSHLWQWHLIVKQAALGHRALRTQTSWTQESRTRASNTQTSPKQISSTGHFNHLFIDFNHQINHCFNDLNHSFINFNHWFIYFKLWYIDFDQWLIDFKRWLIYFNK